MALSGSERVDILRSVLWKRSLVFVQIHVDAYILTLASLVLIEVYLAYQNSPINACSWESGSDSTSSEAVLFEVLDVPGIDTG